jgi:hypothetical protein
MKKIVSLFVVLLFSISVSAQVQEVTQHMSGSWYNSQQEGHGISLEILDNNRAVFYWYIYNPDGTPTFLIALGEVQGNLVLATAYHQTGMHWGTWLPGDVVQDVWGNITLDFEGCNQMTLSYSSTHGRTDIPFGDGYIPMMRLTSVDQTQCQQTRAANIYRGYLELDGDDTSLGATFLMAGDGTFAAWVDDSFAAFGVFGLSEARQGEFYLHHDSPPVLYDFSQQGQPPVDMAAHGFLSPEYHIMVDNWQASQGPSYTGDLYAIDHLYRRGLDFTQWMGLSVAEELVTGETGYIDVWPSEGHLNLLGNMGDGTCSVSGTLTPQDPLLNMMDAELTLNGCGTRDGSYTGLGIQTDLWQFDDGMQLMVFTHDGSNAFALSIDRF